MVKRKSLTLAQARKSLRAFYAQKAGKRRGCGSAHKRKSKRRGNKRGGNPDLRSAQMKRDILRTAQTSKNTGMNQADSFNRMTKHHDDSDLRTMTGINNNKFRNLLKNEAVKLGPKNTVSMAQKRQLQAMARESAPMLNKMSVTPRGSFEVGGRRKRKNSKRRKSKRRDNHGKKRSKRKGSKRKGSKRR